MADPVCREFVEQKGLLCMIVGEDRRVVVYPCVNDTVMNFLLVRRLELLADISSADQLSSDSSKQRIAIT